MTIYGGTTGAQGKPFAVRISDRDRAELARLRDLAMQLEDPPRGWRLQRRSSPGKWGLSLGAFIVWAALQWRPPAIAPVVPSAGGRGEVIPRRRRQRSTKGDRAR